MEPMIAVQNVHCCLGCLSQNDKNKLDSYTPQNDLLKTLFQAENITLCYICKRLAEHADSFIQNVQRNQIFLENFAVITDITLQSLTTQTNPLINLKQSSLFTTEIGINDSSSNEDTVSYVINSKGGKDDVKVKLEFKDEENDSFHNSDDDFVGNDNDFNPYIKEEEYPEDEYPLKLLKQELELEGINIKCLRNTKRKSKIVKQRNVKKRLIDVPENKIEKLYLTNKECFEERLQWSLEPKYLNSEFKCKNCIKGFTYKASYDKHMEKHSESNGDYVCDICKQRMDTNEKLVNHQQCHYQRFKCLECGLIRICHITIKDHYTSMHCNGSRIFICPHCSKDFNRQSSLRKHILCKHKSTPKVQCAYCNKLYASKDCLKNHISLKHPSEINARKKLKSHVCECGKGFSSPSLLKKHAVKHSLRRDFYCVECDKSFKTETILKHHLKTSMSHTSYMDLPLPCNQCEKRFSIRRDLDRHMNRVHLNIKPYQCDQCDKAYINSWSLTEHRKLSHEGYKRPLRFPCTMCDKVFDRKHILKGHIRTHTGERPYQCTKCPAQFSQSSILGTHVKLIHLKLTRDGRPKGMAGLK